MRFAYKLFLIFLLVFASCASLTAQKKDRVEAAQKLLTEAIGKDCKDFKPGRIVDFPKPLYPAEAKTARAGGTIRTTVKIDESGKVTEIEQIEGAKLLQAAATDVARKTKYKPTVCDGSAIALTAVFTYNFIPFVSTTGYLTPAKTEEFTDIKIDSPFYEAVSNLTENYRLAFGYADKKFYADAPLTRGDFAHSLRLTLDLLSERAKIANKLPGEINLFYSFNPQKLVAAGEFKDLKRTDAFNESVKTLLLKYDIALVNERGEFQGKLYLTNNETIDLWTKIFGGDAVPVNFQKISDGDRIITRGEFALFLQESLQVLTYKVLP